MKTLIYVAIAIAVLTFLNISANNMAKLDTDQIPKHYCTWEDCEHQGEEMDQWKFVSQWGHEEMTDEWCVEMTHFMDPHMTYEECEAYVSSGVE